MLLLLFTFHFILISARSCLTHWHVTESGRIETKDDSPFTLLRPYDLAALLKQVDRLERLAILKEIISSKEMKSISPHAATATATTQQSVDSYQEHFYKSDADCHAATQQLSKFAFFETHFVDWSGRFITTFGDEILKIKRDDIIKYKVPYCGSDHRDTQFRLDKNFDHLDSFQSAANITMLAELELVANLAVQPADFFGHLVHKSLLVNASSWVSLTLASDFFRVKGDYLNSIKCFQRAIAFVPRHFADIPLLSLSNMLHKLHFINDSLSVALSAALSVGGRQRDYAFLANYLGNIYVTLGELGEAHKWYDKAAKIDPSFKNSLLKKHATSCHIKLESYLEEQHSRLQKKLDELKDYQTDSDEWFQLSSKIELEKSSRDRKDFTRKVYNDFMSKSHASICDWSKLTTFTLKCARFPVHYSRFPLNSQNLTLEAFQQFYDTLWYLNGTKLDATRDTEGFCVNSTECRQDSLLNLKKGHKNQQEKSLIYSKSGESTASSQSQTDFLNSAAENDLIARLLSERDIKNRFESPSSL